MNGAYSGKVGGAIALSMLLAATTAPGQVFEGPASRTFEIRSEPAGATVETITGVHGKTPASLAERDIYPNTYAPEKVHLYGVITLSREGCRKRTVRPTEVDIQQGLSVDLECDSADSTTTLRGRTPSTGRTSSGDASGEARPVPRAETLPERKLRQLRVIQELLDEGLITAEEEARIRRRILERQ